jgi:hypothetical protein
MAHKYFMRKAKQTSFHILTEALAFACQACARWKRQEKGRIPVEQDLSCRTV